MDFMGDRLEDGRRVRVLTLEDVFTRERLAVEADVSLVSARVVSVLERLVRERAAPAVITVGNGSEFYSRRTDAWASQHGIPGEAAIIVEAGTIAPCVRLELCSDRVTRLDPSRGRPISRAEGPKAPVHNRYPLITRPIRAKGAGLKFRLAARLLALANARLRLKMVILSCSHEISRFIRSQWLCERSVELRTESWWRFGSSATSTLK